MPRRSAKIILGELTHDVTQRSLEREFSQLAQGVQRTELQVTHGKDGAISSVNGIVTFSTPAYAARALRTLPSRRGGTTRLGWNFLQDYRDHELGGACKMMACFGCATISLPLIIFTLFAVFGNIDPKPMQDFANQPVDLLKANVLAYGMSHTCGDFFWGGVRHAISKDACHLCGRQFGTTYIRDWAMHECTV